jgi:CheY-like chemotaxis protein
MSHLMLVDDDEDILAIYKIFLRAGGHTVVTANAGLPALDILDSDQRLDLMITDVMMPGLNGFNLALMARMRRPALKILYLSGGCDSADVAGDRGARLGKLLSKPILANDLCREVDEALAARPPPQSTGKRSSVELRRHLT